MSAGQDEIFLEECNESLAFELLQHGIFSNVISCITEDHVDTETGKLYCIYFPDEKGSHYDGLPDFRFWNSVISLDLSQKQWRFLPDERAIGKGVRARPGYE